MLSSRTTPKVSFNVAMELTPVDTPYVIRLVNDYHQVDAWVTALQSLYRLPNQPDYMLIGPSFDFADVAAGLPEVKAAVDALPPKTSVGGFQSVRVRVGVQGDISGGETNLFAKKLATLVMVLEERLLHWLVPYRYRFRLVSTKSKVAEGPWPQGKVVSADYDSHIPPMTTMKPAAWNNQQPECMYRKFSLIWSAPSLWELHGLLCAHRGLCDFYLKPPQDLPLSSLPWAIEESPQDPSPWWKFGEEFDGLRGSSKSQYDSEESHPYFIFTHLQSTFDHELLHNWVEVIARIVELALASSDEYKRCLETIFMILREEDLGEERAWKQLMKRVLRLEHRIPAWRDQMPEYRR